jgi:hypothetical protein
MSSYEPMKLADAWRRMRHLGPTGLPRRLPTGVDGMRTEGFERNLDSHLREIARRVLRVEDDGLPSYGFGALLTFDRPKALGGYRRIHIPRLRDQVVLRVMHEELIEAGGKSSLLLKPPHPGSFVRAFRSALEKFDDPWVLRTDLVSFYPSIPRDRVISAALALGLSDETGGLLRKWSLSLRSRMTSKLNPGTDTPVEGLPPGLSLSTSLAELWAYGIDRSFAATADPQSFIYFRYVDDIAVVCASREQAETAHARMVESADAHGMVLSTSKTAIARLADGVSWLGLRHWRESVAPEPDRLERWLRRFSTMQRRAALRLRESRNEEERERILREFHRELRDEIGGRTSFRPAWYALTRDTGEWRAMDRVIHRLIRSIHRQAQVDPPAGRRLPSLHRTMLARKSREKASASSNAAQGPCAPISPPGDPTAKQGQTAHDGAETFTELAQSHPDAQ